MLTFEAGILGRKRSVWHGLLSQVQQAREHRLALALLLVHPSQAASPLPVAVFKHMLKSF